MSVVTFLTVVGVSPTRQKIPIGKSSNDIVRNANQMLREGLLGLFERIGSQEGGMIRLFQGANFGVPFLPKIVVKIMIGHHRRNVRV